MADTAGNLWLFGGDGYSSISSGLQNDLWKYNIATNQWTWINGSNASGQWSVYGTMGATAPGNVPSARCSPVSWGDQSGNLWIFAGYFGGNKGGFLDDLWVINP